MKTIIQTPGFEARKELIDFVTSRVGKLDSFNDSIVECLVRLKVEKSATRDTKVCEIKLAIPGNDLFASRRSASFEEAIQKTVEAVRQQINHRRSATSHEKFSGSGASPEPEEESL